MRQLNAASLLCRRIRFSSYPFLGISHLVHTPIRASSLSAIHRGLRDSEKARPQGFKPDSLETIPTSRTSRSTSRSRRDPNWEPPSFKLKKGKKDITDKGPQPKSRRARFHDPGETFGKKSLVYQLKYGILREQLAKLVPDNSGFGKDSVVTKDAFENAFYGRNGREERPKRPGRDSSSFGSRSRPDENRFENKFSRDRQDNRFEGKFSRDRQDNRFEGKFSRDRQETRSESKFPRDREETRFENKFSRDRQETRFENKFSRDKRENRFDNKLPTGRQEGRSETGFSRDRQETRFENKFPKDKQENRFENKFSRDKQDSRHWSPSTGLSGFENKISKDRQDNRFESRFSIDRPPVERENTFQQGRSEPRFSQDKPQARREGAFPESRSIFADSRPPREERDVSTTSTITTTRQPQNDEKDDGPIRIHHTTAASQFLYGRSVVETTLKESRRRLYRMYIYSGEDRQNLSHDAGLERLARQKGIEVTKVGRDGMRMMDKMSGGRPHNGCILEASPLPQLPVKALGPLSEDPAKPGYSVELTYQSSEEAEINGTANFISYQLPRDRKPFVLLLDGILDPGNLGAMLRSAAFLGVNSVAITKHSSATLTPVALKASAGAAEVLSLLSVNSTVDFLARSKESGWMVYAAVPATSRSRGNTHLTIDRIDSYDPLATRPTILVVGSEGEGLTKQVRREADFEVSIPSSSGLLSVVDSLNVSVAAGILCSAFLKKQQQAGVEIEESVPAEEKDKLW